MSHSLETGGDVLLDTTIEGAAAGVRKARSAARAALDGAECAEQAELVISELVTNAVCHAQCPCQLRLTRRQDDLLIEVEDRTPGGLTAGPPLEDNFADHGRGLRIVQSIASRFGVINRAPTGKTVWAEISS